MKEALADDGESKGFVLLDNVDSCEEPPEETAALEEETKGKEEGKEECNSSLSAVKINTSPIGSSPVKYVTDPSVQEKIRAVMNEEGVLVTKPTRAVLQHLVDEFQDHINSCSGTAPEFINVNDGMDYYWKYMIAGEVHKSKFFAIDGVYLDLLRRDGYDDDGCLVLHFPQTVFHNFMSITQALVDKSMRSKGLLVTTKATVDTDDPPAFVLVEEQDSSCPSKGGLVTRQEGLLTDVIQNGTHKHIYKITGFFTLSPRRESDKHPKVFELILVGLRAFSTHDGLLDVANADYASAFG